VIRVAAAVALLCVVFAGDASALTCPELPAQERLAAADVAFVGRIVAERPAGARRVYRFEVDQRVKGAVGEEVEVRAVRLTDLEDRPFARDVAVGVLASEQDGVLVTGSCSLVDPASLLATADEPRGTWIKVAIGVVILGIVLAYSLWRLRRRQRALG
jgi:hypothetical protein